jgi:4-amino-4-deoxy-L-arabinose transferase-like glycosyltransferase
MSATRKQQTAWILAALVILGLTLRIGAIVALRSWEHPSAMEHASLAASLLQHGDFSFGDFGYYGPSSVQSPPYPLLLAGLFWVTRSAPLGYLAAMILNALMGAATVALVYPLARVMGSTRNVGLLAAGAVAIWPTQIYAATFAQAISLITLATVAIVLLYYRSVRGGGVWAWVGFSLIGCLAALTEPVLLPIMALSGLLIFIHRNLRLSIRFRNAAILLAAAIVIIGPWTVRNRIVHGEWIPIKSTFWVNVWKGNNPYATGTDRVAMTPAERRQYWAGLLRLTDVKARENDIGRQYDKLSASQLAQLHDKTEAQREAIFKKWATGWISAHPAAYLDLCLVRLEKTFWIDWDNPKSYKLVYVVCRAVLLVLAAGGLILALRRRWSMGYPALLVGSCLLTYTLTITAARFLLPLEPFFLCLGALCAVTLWQWAAGSQTRTAESNEQNLRSQAPTLNPEP